MALLRYNNISIKGISACVPKNEEAIADYPYFAEAEKERMLPFFGLSRRRVAPADMCASDMCIAAAKDLLEHLNWDKSTVDCLVMVTAAPDYIFPPTSCVVHNRLGLPNDCCSFDIPTGCPGWVYGLTVLGGMMSNGSIKRALLLTGDTPTRFANPKDKSVYPFFGDAGAATAIEYTKDTPGIVAYLGTLGNSYDKIICPAGGARHIADTDSLIEIEETPGVIRQQINTHMEGMDVFSLSTKQDPYAIETLLNAMNKTKDDIDLFDFHITNNFLLNRVIKKIGIEKDRVPYNIENFGNVSCASIPINLVTLETERLRNEKLRHIGCALGVGITFGSIYFETNKLIVPQLIEL